MRRLRAAKGAVQKIPVQVENQTLVLDVFVGTLSLMTSFVGDMQKVVTVKQGVPWST